MSSATTAPTQLDEAEVVPTLPQLAAVIPLASTRHLIAQQLARGASPDGATGAVSAWLGAVIDWREAGVPSGQLGPAGSAQLRDAVRVLVDSIDRGRRPPVRPRPPPPPRVRTAEVIACPPDPADRERERTDEQDGPT